MSGQDEKGPTRYRTDDGSGVYYSCIEVDDMIAKLRTQVKATRYARDGYRGEVYKLTHDLTAKDARIKELEKTLRVAVEDEVGRLEARLSRESWYLADLERTIKDLKEKTND